MGLVFGPVAIEWQLPDAVRTPIGVAYEQLDGRTVYVTLCPIRFRRGDYHVDVPKDYLFDGASIPRPFWTLPGFAPIGLQLWAALCHDWLCDHPDALDREIADAVFSALLKHTRVPNRRRRLMAAAVHAWRILRDYWGGPGR